MIAPRTGYVYDGEVYEKGDEVWDLGLWKHNSNTESRYDYTGHDDMAKLPPYAPSGATAFDPDNGKAYGAYTDPENPTKVKWTEI